MRGSSAVVKKGLPLDAGSPAASAVPGYASFRSTAPMRCVPFVPTYETSRTVLEGSWRCTLKLHCCTYGISAGICVALRVRGAADTLGAPPVILLNEPFVY